MAQAENKAETDTGSGNSSGRSFTDLIGLLSLWLLAAIFLALPLSGIRPVNEIAVADLLIAALIPLAFYLFVARLLLKRRLGEVPKWVYVSAALLVVSIGLVQAFPPDGATLDRVAAAFDAYGLEDGSSLVVGIRVIFSLLVFPLLIGIVVSRWVSLNWLITFWIAGVSLSCAVAILDATLDLGIQQALSYDPDGIRGYLVVFPGDSPRMVGLTEHPNTLSLTGVMVTPLVIARMKTRRGLRVWGPVFLLISLGVLTSGARIGIVGLALAIGLMVIFDERIRHQIQKLSRRTVVAVIVVAALVASLVVVGAYSSPDSTPGKLVPSSITRLLRPGEETRKISDDERESRIDATLDFIADRPFVGYGYDWVESSHNMALQLILAGGILGLIGFFTGLIGYLVTGFRMRMSIPEEYRELSIALTVSFLIYVLSGLLSNHIFSRYLYIPAGLIFAIYFLQMQRAKAQASSEA